MIGLFSFSFRRWHRRIENFAYAKSANLEKAMNGIIYLVGLVVVVMFVLSLLGLH